ncbi:MAG: TonB-dependent receptor, partial [Tannerella sp.]|nr:TonB-dependent receptor [Tannerella sp.]
YHQSTYNNLFIEGLSATAGIRLDWEKQTLDYQSEAKMMLEMQTRPGVPPTDISNMYDASVINEHLSQTFKQLLPKISLKYECSPRTFTYISVAKGYKTGGYNVQMSADIMQSRMQYDVMNKFAPTLAVEPKAVKDVISYRPETSWNYETGMRSELIKDLLHLEATLFYTDINDLQITKFVETGNGRYLSNAGKAESYGAEMSLRAILTDCLTGDLNYGYTHAVFRSYNNVREDFKGKYIPYTPQHTLSLGLQYNKLLRGRFLDRFTLAGQYNGVGKIYWTEANSITQPFYGVVNAQTGVSKGAVTLYLWARNLTDADYAAFYFESFGKPFIQKGKPLQFGTKITINL